MPRPNVVVIVFASIDGRLTTAPGRNVTEWAALGWDGGANEIAHRLCDQLDCDGMVSGSESILVWGNHPVSLDSPHYWPQKSRAFIVFDGRGRIQWGETQGLVVVTREDAPAEYLTQLREKKIDFIQAGRGDHIDLHMALVTLYERGFRRLALTGGGGINGAFLREGLVDEISIVFAPLVVGGTRTPTIFDCPDLTSTDGITRVRLLKYGEVGQGAFWLHYEIVR
jgi:riboflavin biosynthesis pyrimidine reductase